MKPPTSESVHMKLLPLSNAVCSTDVQSDENAQEAMTLLRGIIEDFAGGKSLDDVFRTFDKVADHVKNDEQLKAYFDDVSVKHGSDLS